MPPTENEIEKPAEQPPAKSKVRLSRAGLWIRVIVFVGVILGCGVYAGIFQSFYTSFSPRTCANGNVALFDVDFNAFPARLGEQFNACGGVADGICSRTTEGQTIHGECRNGRMHGSWSLKDAKTGAIAWSGSYCNGLPCGEFRRRIPDTSHEYVFRIESLQVHGPATIWEQDGHRWFEVSGRYDHGKRIGPWVRHAEPGKVVHSTSIYDEFGFVSTTSFRCTNGNRREVRGQKVFLYDSAGHAIDGAVDDASFCPLP